MTNDYQERDEQALVQLPTIYGAKERLTEAQARVLSALAAGYSVCMSVSPSIAPHEQVLIGNGSRLAAITVESLTFRGLIERSGSALEPNSQPGYPEHWRKQIHFYRLTEAGHNEALRQKIPFTPEEVILSLPYRVGLLLEEATRYQLTYQCEPEVTIRGVMDAEQPDWCVRIPAWRRVLAYDEGNNLLGLQGFEQSSDNGKLLWARPPKPRGSWLTSSVRLRLRPT